MDFLGQVVNAMLGEVLVAVWDAAVEVPLSQQELKVPTPQEIPTDVLVSEVKASEGE